MGEEDGEKKRHVNNAEHALLPLPPRAGFSDVRSCLFAASFSCYTCRLASKAAREAAASACSFRELAACKPHVLLRHAAARSKAVQGVQR